MVSDVDAQYLCTNDACLTLSEGLCIDWQVVLILVAE